MAAVAASASKLEAEYDIPVAPVATLEFKSVADDLRSANMSLPFIYTPHPVVGMSPEALDKYIAGDDPDTHKPVIGEIIDALTRPVDVNRNKPEAAVTVKTDTSSIFLEPDTEDNFQRLFFERGWTDGLPVILPTEERVKRMLAGTGRPPDEVVGEIEIINFDNTELVKYTVSNIAIFAVMAGARPEHFPVILAIASTRQAAFTPSTTAFSSMILVNGPIRKEIGMNAGMGAYSPINLANSVIGRSWTIMSICWGYTRPKKTLWSSQGNNFLYNNMCAAENEERSVWTPFHVDKGFKPGESTVSLFRGWTLFNSDGAAAHRTVGEELNYQMQVMPGIDSAATIIIDPLVARNLKENEGFATKRDFCVWLSKNLKIPAGRYWGTDHVDLMMGHLPNKGVEPYASWKKAPPDELIPHYFNADNINILVVGGETSPLWKASDYGYLTSASIDKWRPAGSAIDCKDGSCGLPDPEDIDCKDGSCGLPDAPAEYDK
ncbi:MAG: UGSC family (seleno)protein [Dehalococcoidales bacterium]